MPDDFPHSPSLSEQGTSPITGAEPGLRRPEAIRKPSVGIGIRVYWHFLERLWNKKQPAVIANLWDADPTVREKAAYDLHFMGNKNAIPALLRVIDTDPSPSVRRQAIESFMRIIERFGVEGISIAEAADIILQAAHHEDVPLRAEAMWTLAELGIDAVLPHAIEAFEHQDPALRRASLACVARLNKAQAIDLYIRAFDDPAPEVRWGAALAAGRLGDERLRPGLERCLNDPHQGKVLWGDTIQANARRSLKQISKRTNR